MYVRIRILGWVESGVLIVDFEKRKEQWSGIAGRRSCQRWWVGSIRIDDAGPAEGCGRLEPG